jgi:hypothetical protein
MHLSWEFSFFARFKTSKRAPSVLVIHFPIGYHKLFVQSSSKHFVFPTHVHVAMATTFSGVYADFATFANDLLVLTVIEIRRV